MSLAKSSSHSSLESISSSTRQHFVDPKNVEGVHAHPNVELVLAAVLHQILVAADTGGLQGLAGKLLQLIGHQDAAAPPAAAPALGHSPIIWKICRTISGSMVKTLHKHVEMRQLASKEPRAQGIIPSGSERHFIPLGKIFFTAQSIHPGMSMPRSSAVNVV